LEFATDLAKLAVISVGFALILGYAGEGAHWLGFHLGQV